MNYLQEIEKIEEYCNRISPKNYEEKALLYEWKSNKLFALAKKMQGELEVWHLDALKESELGKKIDEIIKKVEQREKWIPCSERLPEKSDYYWVTMENRKGERLTMKWFYQLDLGFSQIEGKVIAWMPLPEPFNS